MSVVPPRPEPHVSKQQQTGRTPKKTAPKKTVTVAAKKAGTTSATAKKQLARVTSRIAKAEADPKNQSEFTPGQARKVTERIRNDTLDAARGMVAAFRGRIWLALRDTDGAPYKTWVAYQEGELDGLQISVARQHRPELVADLYDAGASQNIIASIVNVTRPTVANDIKAIRSQREAEAKHVQSERVDVPQGANYLPPAGDTVPDLGEPQDADEAPLPTEEPAAPATNGEAPSTTSIGGDGKEYTRSEPTPKQEKASDPLADVRKFVAKGIAVIKEFEAIWDRDDVRASEEAKAELVDFVSDILDMARVTGLMQAATA